jgi:hypothetical protein
MVRVRYPDEFVGPNPALQIPIVRGVTQPRDPRESPFAYTFGDGKTLIGKGEEEAISETITAIKQVQRERR